MTLPVVCQAQAWYAVVGFFDASQSATMWNINGNTQEGYGPTDYGLRVSDASGASLISTVAVPDGSNQYWVTIATNDSLDGAGSTYLIYLEATPDSLLNLTGESSGSFYAFAMQKVANANGCQVQVTLYKTVSGTVSQVAGTSVPCQGDYTAAAAADGSLRLAISVNNESYEPIVWRDSSRPLTGAAGIGEAGPGDGSSAHMWEASLYAVSRMLPSTIAAATVQTYVAPTEVDIRTGGSSDPAGEGIEYQWYRDGEMIAATFNPEFSDITVAAGSTHVFGVNVTDMDGNTSAITSFTVPTPSAANIEAREIGIRSTGSYWGGMGEQIDMRSGNLNYSYPLLTAVSRGYLLRYH
jgi:hypothetical protein